MENNCGKLVQRFSAQSKQYNFVNVMKTGPLDEWKKKEHEFVNKIIQYIPKPINCMPNRAYDLVTSYV
uniref:Uncharacterized protein n=1 Tax=Caenorhabditis japonica TaxID=281687 RepID=A0A8R1I7A9_CAEJA